jgi:DNA-binding CsgD family transcriptional regulator
VIKKPRGGHSPCCTAETEKIINNNKNQLLSLISTGKNNWDISDCFKINFNVVTFTLAS